MTQTHSHHEAHAAAALPGSARDTFRRIPWGAIFAGVVVALTTLLALNLLGLGVGMSNVDPASGDVSERGLGIGAAIWLIVSTVLALLAGGWVAGRLAGFPRRLDSALHGLITFATVTLLTAYFATTTVGSLISGMGRTLGGMANAAGETATAVTPAATQGVQEVFGMAAPSGAGGDPGAAEGMINDWLSQQGIQLNNPQATEQVTQAGQDYLQALIMHRGDTQAAQPQRDALVNTIATNSNLSRSEVETEVDQLQQQATQRAQQGWQTVQREAAETGEAAAEGVAAASFGTFLALVLGGAAAVLGAYLATPNDRAADRYAAADNH